VLLISRLEGNRFGRTARGVSRRLGPSGSRRRTVALYAALAVVVVGGVVGFRAATASTHVVTHTVAAPAARAVPVNPAIEQAWGIRFTAAYLLADNGLIDLRYQILDSSKSERLHSGAQNDANLPTIIDERDGKPVHPSSSILHFHHGTPGQGITYSVIYGNAGDAIQVGDQVTIRMTDGLELKHVLVTN